MDDVILQRIRRIYAAIGAIEEDDPRKLKATVIETDKMKAMIQNFRGGLSDDELSNQVHIVIHNISSLRDYLCRWTAQNGKDKTKIDQIVNDSAEIQIILDLWNNDKHGGYPPRDGGYSGKSPQLVEINRVMCLQPQAIKGSMIGMTLNAKGFPEFFGKGTAKAVITGNVVDNANNKLGDLYEIVNKAIEAWERLLVDFGLG
jgi:putative cofactor-binding repeat protein